ncbi:MAG: DNA-binding protein HU-beta [Limisphaerales bacterium]|jgi:DNA-binding protein HU-beta
MRKADLIARISEKTGIAKVDVLVALEALFKEVKESLKEGENVYVRGFGSFIVKKRARKIGRNIKKNVAIEIPEHNIPSFKPAKVFVEMIKNSDKAVLALEDNFDIDTDSGSKDL